MGPTSPQTIKHLIHCQKQQNNDNLRMEDEWIKLLENGWKYGLQMKWNKTQMIESAACCLALGSYQTEYHAMHNDLSLIWFKRGYDLLQQCECIKVQKMKKSKIISSNALNQKNFDRMQFNEEMDDYSMNITQDLMEKYQRNLVQKFVDKTKVMIGWNKKELNNVFECNYYHSLKVDDNEYAAGIYINYAQFLQLSDLKEAEKWYLRALKLTKNDDTIYWNLGQIYWKNKDYEKAMKHFKLALKYCSNDEVDAVQKKIYEKEKKMNKMQKIKSNVKEDVFDEMDVCEEYKQKMRKKMNEIMAGYNKQFGNEPDEMTKIKNQIHLFLDEEINDDEIDFMIKYCDENGEDVQSNIQNYGIHFLEMIRTQKKQLHENEQNNHNISEQYDDECNSDEEYVPMQVQKSKKRKKKKRVKARSKQSNESELSMDEWLASLSSIQRKSFKERTKSDNAFFYRFNASHIDSDDKIQRDLINLAENKKGTWSKSEHQIFMKQVLKIGVNISWGIFSKDIAGRVGYVCSNYWRALIKNGDVKDLNYVQSTNNEKKLSL